MNGKGREDMDAFYHAASQLPGAVSQALMRIPPRWAGDITEIRLRSGRPVSLSTPSGARFVSIDGGWREKPDTGVLSTPHTLVQNCFQAICNFLLQIDRVKLAFIHCLNLDSKVIFFLLSDGFVPLPGGHRAGVCGTAFVDGSGTFTLKNITSINLRVARTGLCACDAVLRPLLCAPGVGLLIAGAPGSGKTTLLRAVLAELSAAGRKTAVVDERFEIAPVEQSGFCTRLPQHCDVLSGYPKHIGMQHALRALAPDVIVCDEVGAMEDIAAITQAANAGVGLVVTIHAPDAETLRRRPQYTALLQTGAFRHVAFLKGKETPGRISEVVDAGTVF